MPLPPEVAEAVRTIPPGPKPNPRYFYWSGNGLPKSAVADWQRSYRRLFTLAKLEKPDGTAKRCFPHMFRDTFAVEMLLAGVPISGFYPARAQERAKISAGFVVSFAIARTAPTAIETTIAACRPFPLTSPSTTIKPSCGSGST